MGVPRWIDRWRVDTRRGELLESVELPDRPVDPEAAALQREQRRQVRRAVAGLPRPQRRAALARFHADLSYEEAARQLGTPVVTARTRVHRALAALRARLGTLRALFVCPGFQTAALGFAFFQAGTLGGFLGPPATTPPGTAQLRQRVVAQAPAGPRGSLIDAEPPASAASARARHLAAARVIAAETPAPPRPPVAARSTMPPPRQDPAPVQSFEFDNDEVTGDLQSPDIDVLTVARPVAQPSLIELRRHFVPELLKTLEDL